MLVDEQRHFIDYILHVSDNTKQQFIFVTGEAGTGKSHLLKAVVNALEARNENKQLPVTLVAAYTGYAALNVKGSTIHSALKISVHQSSTPDKKETLTSLRGYLSELKWLILDEISLVSERFLSSIDQRLRTIKCTPEKPFGNVHLLFFGDLLQLPPVTAKPIYFNDYWNSFSMYELKYLHRQRDDAIYARLCNRARVGKLTLDDYNLLLTRHISNLTQDVIDSFNDAIHVVLYKREAKKLNDVKQAQFVDYRIFEAIDTIKPFDPDYDDINNVPKSLEDDVPKKLKLAVGSKVMLKVNINVSKGIVNGQIGTVVKMDDIYDLIFVKFEVDGETFVSKIERKQFKSRIGPKQYFCRCQYPLIHSWAINVHKVQGITLNKAIISIGKHITSCNSSLKESENGKRDNFRKKLFCTGLVYTILSRVKTLSGLLIYALDKDTILTSNYSEKALEVKESMKILDICARDVTK